MLKRKKSADKSPPPIMPGNAAAISVYVAAGIALILFAVFVTYLPSINGDFILDDDVLLTNNEHIAAQDGLYTFWFTTKPQDYWPVTNSALWIQWRLWGMNPIGYHLTNLLLHAAESLLIWLVLRKLSIPGAFLAGLIFAVHPVNVESVAWISSLKNLLAMLFFLLSILWFLNYIEHARLRLAAKQILPTADCLPPTFSSFILHPSSFHFWYWLSLAAFILAMLSKGSAAVLPALLLGIAWWQRRSLWKSIMLLAPYFILALILAFLNVWFQKHGKDIIIRPADFTERLLDAGCAVWFYLYKALLPIDLAFVYPQWKVQTGNLLWWLPLLAIMIVTAILVCYGKGWGRPLLFGWGFFCVALVPVLGFTDVGFMQFTLVADRYQHIAIIGVIALAAAGFSAWRRQTLAYSRYISVAAAVLAVGVLALLSSRQCENYRNGVALYQAALEKNPNCWMIYNNLGKSLYNKRLFQEAIVRYRQAIEIKPDYAVAYYNLGLALDDSRQITDAIECYQEALRINPNLIEAYNNLGNAMLKTGQTQEAIEYHEKALGIKPNSADILNNLGTALYTAGRKEEAIARYNNAINRKPDYADAYFNLAMVQANMGRPGEAVINFEQAQHLNPIDIDINFNLALTYAALDRSAEAVNTAQKALRLAISQKQADQAKKIEEWLNANRQNK